MPNLTAPADFPRVQIVTVAEIIEQHKRMELPLAQEVLKTAKAVETVTGQAALFEE